MTRGRKKVLDDIDKQNTIIERISKTGKDLGCWEGVCAQRTFYEYLVTNLQFAQSVRDAKDRFRRMLWNERPDLKEKAIKRLENSLDGAEQSWVKKTFIHEYDTEGNEKKILVQTQEGVSKNPPSPWAIKATLMIDTKNEEDNSNPITALTEILSDIAEETKKRDLK